MNSNSGAFTVLEDVTATWAVRDLNVRIIIISQWLILSAKLIVDYILGIYILWSVWCYQLLRRMIDSTRKIVWRQTESREAPLFFRSAISMPRLVSRLVCPASRAARTTSGLRKPPSSVREEEKRRWRRWKEKGEEREEGKGVEEGIEE